MRTERIEVADGVELAVEALDFRGNGRSGELAGVRRDATADGFSA